MTRHPNEPGFVDVPPPATESREPERRQYDPSMRPIWTHGADGKPNRKIWIPRTEFGNPGEHRNPPPDRSEQLRRYEANNRILLRLSDASPAGLERFAAILESLTNEQLDDVARFAKALGENPFGEVG